MAFVTLCTHTLNNGMTWYRYSNICYAYIFINQFLVKHSLSLINFDTNVKSWMSISLFFVPLIIMSNMTFLLRLISRWFNMLAFSGSSCPICAINTPLWTALATHKWRSVLHFLADFYKPGMCLRLWNDISFFERSVHSDPS